MKFKSVALASAAAVMMAAPAMAQDIKIGWVTTLTTPAALIGNEQKKGADLAMDHLGHKMAGKSAKILYEDDGLKPKIGKQKTEKLVKKDKVDIMAGYIWSHVLGASAPVVLKANKFMFSANAGHSIYSGKKCHKNFFNVSWENSQNAEATGEMLNQKGIKKLYIGSLNYAAGKQIVGGLERSYKGKVVGKDLVPLDHKDWSAELAKIKAAKPDAVVVFYPGSWGPKFFTQYNQAGLNKTTPLYHMWSVGMDNLPIFQKNGINVLNTEQTAQWAPNLDNAANKKFVAGFKKKYGALPSHFAAQAYETVMLINSGVSAVGGDFSKMDALRAAFEKADFEAVRGNFRYGKNHYPIQDFYSRKVVKGDDGKWTIIATGKVVSDSAPYNSHECKL